MDPKLQSRLAATYVRPKEAFFRAPPNRGLLPECVNGAILPRFICQVFLLRSGRILYPHPAGWIQTVGDVLTHDPESSIKEPISSRPDFYNSSTESLKWGAGGGEEEYAVQKSLGRGNYHINEDHVEGNVLVEAEVDDSEPLKRERRRGNRA